MHLPVEVALREVRRRTRQPAVDDRLSQLRLGNSGQLNQHSGVAIEVRNGEEGPRVGGQRSFLLAQVVHANSQDRAFRAVGRRRTA